MADKNPQYMADEMPDEVPEHRDGEPCSCAPCEDAALSSRAEALADREGYLTWKEMTRPLTGGKLSSCCAACESEAYPAEHQICPRCKDHCTFVRDADEY